MIFSERARRLSASSIQEILELIARPEVISFAGGVPAPELFPVEAIRVATERVLLTDPRRSLQYSASEGLRELRRWIADYCSGHGEAVDPGNVLVTTGSQQALDLLGKTLLDERSRVLVEAPTYLGALQALSVYGARFSPVESDELGPIPARVRERVTADTRFLYLVSDFQNPTGRRVSLERRRALLEATAASELLIIEDNPYGELAFDGIRIPSLASLAPTRVVHVSSFSKLLSPGLRVGYVIAPRTLHSKLVQMRQAADLHSPTFTQSIVYELLRGGALTERLERLRAHYELRCQTMLASLARHFPPEAQWSKPAGGMFIWVTLPVGMDSGQLLRHALQDNVAFVPGDVFYSGPSPGNTLRLSFATVEPASIEKGIAILGRWVRHMGASPETGLREAQ